MQQVITIDDNYVLTAKVVVANVLSLGTTEKSDTGRLVTGRKKVIAAEMR